MLANWDWTASCVAAIASQNAPLSPTTFAAIQVTAEQLDLLSDHRIDHHNHNPLPLVLIFSRIKPRFHRLAAPFYERHDSGTSNLPWEWNKRSKPSRLSRNLLLHQCQPRVRRFPEHPSRPNEEARPFVVLCWRLNPLELAPYYPHISRNFSFTFAIALHHLKDRPGGRTILCLTDHLLLMKSP